MESSRGEERRVGAFWPLLGLRYLLIVIAVLTWLYEADRSSGFVTGTLLFSLMLVFEPFAYWSPSGRRQSLFVLIQLLLGLTGLLVRPALPATLMLTAIVAGIAAVAPLGLSLVALAVTLSLTIVRLNESVALFGVVIGLYVLSFAFGRLDFERSEEARNYRRLVDQFEDAQRRLAQYAETSRSLAVAQERQQMAEALHDSLGHALVASLLQVQVVSRLMESDPRGARQRLAWVEEHIRQTLEQVRTALRRGVRHRSQLPLHMALESLAADFQAAGGPEVHLDFRPDPQSVSDVSPETTEVLYRTVQEALTNAVRHGAATRIVVEAEVVRNRLYLRIRDNGVGAEQYTPGMGLSGMVSRIQAIGGTLRFETAKDRGFLVEVGVRMQ